MRFFFYLLLLFIIIFFFIPTRKRFCASNCERVMTETYIKIQRNVFLKIIMTRHWLVFIKCYIGLTGNVSNVAENRTVIMCLCIYSPAHFKTNYVELSYKSFTAEKKKRVGINDYNTFKLQLKERNVLYNDALNTFYLRLYDVGHMVKDHSDRERGKQLPLHRLLLLISSKGSLICTIPHTRYHIPRPSLYQSWSTGWNEK